MQLRFNKPESEWDETIWAAYDETLKYCRDHRYELKDYGDYFAVYEPTIADFRAKALARLAQSFDERVTGSFTTSQGYKMQFDTTDAIKMEGAIKLLEATSATEGYLTQADDTTIYNVPLDTMKAVLMEMMTAFAACHARKQELRAAIKAAETVEELDAIKITWPL